MKIASLIARLLLGLIFLVFGLNGFLHFIPMPPPTGAAGQFFAALIATPYWMVIFAVQVIGGVLLLVNRFVPLALVVLGSVIPRSVRVSEAPSYGQSVMTYDPGSSGAQAYLEAAREIASSLCPAPKGALTVSASTFDAQWKKR